MLSCWRREKLAVITTDTCKDVTRRENSTCLSCVYVWSIDLWINPIRYTTRIDEPHVYTETDNVIVFLCWKCTDDMFEESKENDTLALRVRSHLAWWFASQNIGGQVGVDNCWRCWDITMYMLPLFNFTVRYYWNWFLFITLKVACPVDAWCTLLCLVWSSLNWSRLNANDRSKPAGQGFGYKCSLSVGYSEKILCTMHGITFIPHE